jgi:hypothetical protein
MGRRGDTLWHTSPIKLPLTHSISQQRDKIQPNCAQIMVREMCAIRGQIGEGSEDGLSKGNAAQPKLMIFSLQETSD